MRLRKLNQFVFIIFLFVLFGFLFTFKAQAAAMTGFTYRQSSVMTSVSGFTFYLEFTAPNAAAGVTAVSITFPAASYTVPAAGYTVAGVAGVSPWTGYATCTTVAGTAAGAGQVITVTTASLVSGAVRYCFTVTSATLITPAAAGNSVIDVATVGVTPDSMAFGYYTVSNDSVIITAVATGYVSCDVTTTSGADNLIFLGNVRYGAITSSATMITPDNILVRGATNNATGMKFYYRSDPSFNGLRSTIGAYTMAGPTAEGTLSTTNITCAGATPCYGIYYNGTKTGGGTWTADASFTGGTATTDAGPMTTAVYGSIIGSTSDITSNLTVQYNVNATLAQDTPEAADYTDTLIFTCSASM